MAAGMGKKQKGDIDMADEKAPQKASKVYSSRVNEATARKMAVLRRLTGNSDRRIVKDGLDRVVDAASRDEARLRQQYQKRLQSQIDSVAGLSAAANADSSTGVGREAARFEVAKGNAMMVQADVDAVTHKMLEMIGKWTERNESELVRHGLFLVFDDLRRRERHYLKKLEEGFQADKNALLEPISTGLDNDSLAESAKRRSRSTGTARTKVTSSGQPASGKQPVRSNDGQTPAPTSEPNPAGV